MNTVQTYIGLVKEQDRNKEAIALLEKATEDPKVFEGLTD
jgi:hypothetical protein